MWKRLTLPSLAVVLSVSCGPGVGSGDGTSGGTAGETGEPSASGPSSVAGSSCPAGTTGSPGTTDGDTTGSATDVSTSGATATTLASSGEDTTGIETTTGSDTTESSCHDQRPDVGGETDVCGDGRITGAEECEDGNAESFDGCSAACRIEHPVVEVQATIRSTCALAQNGGLKCWGHDWQGLGYGDIEARGDEPNEMGAFLPPLDLGATVDDFGGVGVTRCAQTSDGEIKCWGLGSGGELGHPTEASIGDEPGEMGCSLLSVDMGEQAAGIGDAYSCAILASGGLKCWGDNAYGQLGLGDVEARGDDPDEMGANLPEIPLGGTIVAVDRYAATCALDEDGRLKCWGGNEYCLLGRPDPLENIGDAPGEMEALEWMDLGSAFGVADLGLGIENACAVFEDGSLKCWGFNYHGFLYATPDATGWGCGADQMGENLPAMELGADQSAVQVSVGNQYGCVLLDDGAVKCWGDPSDGGLGNGTEDWVYWGLTLADIPPVDLGGEAATQVSVGIAHACALLESGYVKCWGRNDRGQLGYGDTENRGDEPGEMGTNLPYVELF